MRPAKLAVASRAGGGSQGQEGHIKGYQHGLADCGSYLYVYTYFTAKLSPCLRSRVVRSKGGLSGVAGGSSPQNNAPHAASCVKEKRW